MESSSTMITLDTYLSDMDFRVFAAGPLASENVVDPPNRSRLTPFPVFLNFESSEAQITSSHNGKLNTSMVSAQS